MKKIFILLLLANILCWPFFSSAKTESKAKEILQKVPFSSQAPYGNWKDQRQQDGCEEISVIMAMKWVKNEKLSKDEALKEIIKISDWEQKKYGEYRDISASSTLNWIINDYFNYKKAKLINNVSLKIMISELEKGNIIIAPMNGQLLRNPNYTAPGPIHHMIVIIGYNPQKNIFITNDSGTRNGASYKYDANLFFKAINDYPTGYHKSNKNIEKNIIIVSK